MNSPDHPTVMLRLDGDPCLKPGLRPFWVHLWDHFIRDHRKIIVIDGRVCFAGA